MNDTSFILSSKFLGYEVMGYIPHPKVMSSWMMVFLPYHTKLGEVLSNTLWSFYPKTSDDVSAAQQHLFSC